MRMKNFNLTPRVKKAIQNAQNFAKEMGHQRVNCAHIFKSVLELDYPLFNSLFRPYLINHHELADKVVPYVMENHPSFFKKRVNQKTWHNEVEEILKFSNEVSTELKQEYVGVEHVLYALVMTSPTVRAFLKEQNFPVEEFSASLISYMKPSPTVQPLPQLEEVPIEEEIEEKTKFVSKYCTNLNKIAEQGKLNNLYGREEEINLLVETILRKTKNNAILIGDPGVGKTAIVEGLAAKIVSGEITPLLQNRVVVSFNMANMVAGTKYRGQFEERFQGLLDELKKDPRYILFVDEIHTMIGAGSGEGSLDVANMIKPALARGEITCIGATTHSEYKKLFEKDGALRRRFESIIIDEPKTDEVEKIILGAKDKFEQFHGVVFSPERIKNLIYLCEKYLPYRKFPDKAFDMLDFISARVKVATFKMPKNIVQLEKKIRKIVNSNSNAEKVKCNEMILDYAEKLHAWASKDQKKIEITKDHLVEVFAQKLKIQKNKIVLPENEDTEDIAETLKKSVFGQDQAIDKISDILACSRAGLKSKNKPMGKFLFIGPTGVGKTWTAKLIAEKFLGNEKMLLKLDMSEYQESSTINKLIGSTIGYIGSEEGGILTEFVRNNPSCVVLFDEIEKAHRDLNSILLQIMDDGYVTDNLGRRVDFSNTIIILTGNIGQESATPKPSMGFVPQSEKPENGYKKAVEAFFRPEFLARLDDIIIFEKISNKEFHKILENLIINTEKLMAQQGRNIKFSEQVFSFLLKKVEENGNNARSIEKIYRQFLEVPLAKFILKEKGEEIICEIIEEKARFSVLERNIQCKI
jgi:ATP-dependent Clp protease ATP-binding subunit ClpC